jgi:hypothetical protein
MGSIIRYSGTGFPLQHHIVLDSGVRSSGEFRFTALLVTLFLDVLAWNCGCVNTAIRVMRLTSPCSSRWVDADRWHPILG